MALNLERQLTFVSLIRYTPYRHIDIGIDIDINLETNRASAVWRLPP